MPFDPSQFDQGPSRFSTGPATQRGSFASYLSGESRLDDYSGMMSQGFKPPQARNAKRAEAEAAQGDARNMGLWTGGLNTTSNQFQSTAQLGNAALSGIQQAQQAREMAKLGIASAQQGSLFGGISAGISLLGGIGHAAWPGVFK